MLCREVYPMCGQVNNWNQVKRALIKLRSSYDKNIYLECRNATHLTSTITEHISVTTGDLRSIIYCYNKNIMDLVSGLSRNSIYSLI